MPFGRAQEKPSKKPNTLVGSAASEEEKEVIASSQPTKSHLGYKSDIPASEGASNVIDPELQKKIRELGQLVRADTADEAPRTKRSGKAGGFSMMQVVPMSSECASQPEILAAE